MDAKTRLGEREEEALAETTREGPPPAASTGREDVANGRHGQLANLQPAAPGNDLAVSHGAYAILRLTPRAEAITADVRHLVPAYSDRDEPAVQELGMVLAQLEPC